jgi:hypothetical protein
MILARRTIRQSTENATGLGLPGGWVYASKSHVGFNYDTSYPSNSVLMNETFRGDLTDAYNTNTATVVSLLDAVYISLQIDTSDFVPGISPPWYRGPFNAWHTPSTREIFPERIAKYLSKFVEAPLKTTKDPSQIYRQLVQGDQFYWTKQSKFLTRVHNGLV